MLLALNATDAVEWEELLVKVRSCDLFFAAEAHNETYNREKPLRNIYRNLWENTENTSPSRNPHRQQLRRGLLHQYAPRYHIFLVQLLHASLPSHVT